ncbi:AAA family ATPase [Priestia megaterium]|uniref:AAA family ATPase n=1 Tax=Priestia megaterium TaxID=1404 RepID=UPI0025B1CB23|nr:AAA family ATPase [Priestia megaterium]MDN3233103.1 AAA family ATPase [Priestia megaterium]
MDIENINIKSTHLKNLFLDPNNYRFINHDDYRFIKDKDLKEPRIQARTMSLLSGIKNENLADLIESFKKNGYLPVDQIQVRRISSNEYLVIEGNRRVATLKLFQKMYEENREIGNLDPSLFRKVPIVYYDTEQSHHHQVVMGLKHISGNKKWPALNQAQYLEDLISKFGMEERDVAESLGISMMRLRRSRKTLSLIDEYKKSDYGDQFQTDMYSIFEEIVKTPSIKEWIDWSEVDYKAENIINRDRLFSWISEDEEFVEESEEEIRKLDKIIVKSTDIRDLSKFIHDKKAIANLERSRSITQAYAFSDRVKEDKFENALNILEEQVNEANIHSQYASDDSYIRVKHVIDKLNGLAASKGFANILDNKAIQRNVFFNFKTTHFSYITINKYKALTELNIKHLNKINIFAGINNAGKSSLLEAIYLLTRQNDIFAFFDINRRRGKFNKSLDSVWFHSQPLENIHIKGEFDHKDISVKIRKEEEDSDTLDKNSYLSSIQLVSTINGDTYKSKARIYKDKENESFFKNIHILCNSVLSSPFSIQNKEDIISSHEKSVESKNLESIIQFLKEKLDSKIENVELAGELSRFLVTHHDFDKAIDITQFGEGMQRIYHIALQFALAENGVLLIDEIENAIHYSLLKDFATLIQQLANRFNVQVFMTSHSKECIDAFINNDFENENISAYRLENYEGTIACKYISGEKLQRLIKSIDLDLRGDS